MKKFINDVDDVLVESLSGLVEAHPDLLRVEFAPTFIARKTKADSKVALISGGGSGHEPLHAGFVGTGMLDAACPGQVFTSPTPDQMLAAAKAVDGGKGVLFIVKNYAGDSMNFQIASEMLALENTIVLVNVVLPSRSVRTVVTCVSPASQSSQDSVFTIRSDGTIST